MTALKRSPGARDAAVHAEAPPEPPQAPEPCPGCAAEWRLDAYGVHVSDDGRNWVPCEKTRG